MFAVMDGNGKVQKQVRIDHEPGAIQGFLSSFPEGTKVALETVGNWYWIVNEIEAAGCQPLMAHAVKAKIMMGNINKTDKLDAAGLATPTHLNSLPTVWLASKQVRDERELPRTRMAFTKLRTSLKNRMHATLAKHNRSLDTDSDIFAPKWREDLEIEIHRLPPETTRYMLQEFTLLDEVIAQIKEIEQRITAQIKINPQMQLLDTLPGIGKILAVVIEREIGSIERFPDDSHLAAYAGVVPTVHASGGHIRYGHMRKKCNRYLKWAYIEAANAVVRNHKKPHWRTKHVTRLYLRIRARKGHTIAVGAAASHLALASF
jgi:transposase